MTIIRIIIRATQEQKHYTVKYTYFLTQSQLPRLRGTLRLRDTRKLVLKLKEKIPSYLNHICFVLLFQ